jgi:hypothetical protein
MRVSGQVDKGTRFETAVARYLSAALGGGVERRAKHGRDDRGDLSGVFLRGLPVVVECKDRRRMELPAWLGEAEAERGNADAAYGVVVHHRAGRGAASMADQYVTMTLGTFAAMLAGGPDGLEEG